MDITTAWVILIITLIILAACLIALTKTSKAPSKPYSDRPLLEITGDKRCYPTKAHQHDAGLDLRAATGVYIRPEQRCLVDTGIRVSIPAGYVGLVCPRSGLAHKQGVTVLNAPGIIDAGYTGPLKVNLVNLGSRGAIVQRHDRIAQLVIMPVTEVRVKSVQELSAWSERGEHGHGSTGVK